jgi:MarR family transcriptional regulator, organic hydroperoxide resistance regulator
LSDDILDGFVERLFRLMDDHHRLRAVQMDLTPVQAQALQLLRREPLPTSRLAVALGISTPAVTQLTDRLGRKKLVERQSVAADRRVALVAITDLGGRLIDTLQQLRKEVFSDVLSRLAEEDRADVMGALRKIAAILHVPEKDELPFLSAHTSSKPGADGKRTANRQVQTSKDVGREPVIRPPKRMKIEWD